MLRTGAWVLVGLLTLALVVFVSQIVASETGEVVVLTTLGPEGAAVETRLWVVDHEGSQYLRASEGSGWYGRLLAEPAVELGRGENVSAYVAVPAPEVREPINGLMREKYGWRDVYISWLAGDRDDAIPIRMDVR